jgi:transcriptional regulator with XRE-family HTH domain
MQICRAIMSAMKGFSGRRLLQARLRAGLTQAELAHRLRLQGYRVDTSAISRWERGAHVPSADILPGLALATRHEIADFFGDDEGEEEEDLTAELLAALRPLADLVARRGRVAA